MNLRRRFLLKLGKLLLRLGLLSQFDYYHAYLTVNNIAHVHPGKNLIIRLNLPASACEIGLVER